MLDYPGNDMDLHVTDSFGRHVGVNYSTGQVDLQIPGATYSGATSRPERILVPVTGNGKFTVETVAVTTSGAESYSVIANDIASHPATLNVCAVEIDASGSPGSLASASFGISEIGGQNPITGLIVTTSDLTGPGGTTIPASSITCSSPSTIPVGGEVIATIQIHIPVVNGVFSGTVHVQSEQGSIDIPLRLDSNVPVWSQAPSASVEHAVESAERERDNQLHLDGCGVGPVQHPGAIQPRRRYDLEHRHGRFRSRGRDERSEPPVPSGTSHTFVWASGSDIVNAEQSQRRGPHHAHRHGGRNGGHQRRLHGRQLTTRSPTRACKLFNARPVQPSHVQVLLAEQHLLAKPDRQGLCRRDYLPTARPGPAGSPSPATGMAMARTPSACITRPRPRSICGTRISLQGPTDKGYADVTFAYGPAGAGWIPIAGDWDGDGKDTIGLYNPATSTFYLAEQRSPCKARPTWAMPTWLLPMVRPGPAGCPSPATGTAMGRTPSACITRPRPVLSAKHASPCRARPIWAMPT